MTVQQPQTFDGATKKTGAPLIGILSNLLVEDSSPFPGLERSYVNHDYVQSVEAAGGIPVMLPVVADSAIVARQIAAVDGVLLTGGYDPSPLLFGENPGRRLEFFFPEVDAHQLAAIQAADSLGKPMFGICRGLQILNVAFGGTLYQDLTLIPGSYIQHVQKSRRDAAGHEVMLESGSRLAGIFGTTAIRTNSFHHLALKDIAPGFMVNAHAPDGVVEGFERTEGTPVFAVQWHPEMMFRTHPEMLLPFAYFMDQVRTAAKI